MISGAVLMMLGVILGALGAHALEKTGLSADSLESYETAVRYQIYHGLALLILGQSKYLSKTLIWLFIIGVLMFSVSIYLLVTDELFNADFSFLGPITPIGGVLLILGWCLLIVNIIREKSRF